MHRLNLLTKIISVIIALVFLCNNAVWAYPTEPSYKQAYKFNRSTLSQQSSLKDEAFRSDVSASAQGGVLPTSAQLAQLSEGTMIGSAPIMMDRADGVYLWDTSGKRYLDLFSQTWSLPLGHNNPAVIEAARGQLDKITHLRTAYSTIEKFILAQRITALSPDGLDKVHFVAAGSLAVEGAMKLAMNNYKDRQKILYLEEGFHGRSLATMGVSWRLPDERYSDYMKNGIEVKKELGDIEQKMISERPAAIILELVQGDGGCRILDKELVKGIRRLCDEHDVVMIVDEVQTGFGCVEKMFLCDDYGITPDILVFGKAVGGGFALAGTLYNKKFSFSPGEHSFTFGHNPVSMAAGLAFLEELEPALGKVDGISQQIESSLRILEDKYKNLSGARYIGVKGAIDITDEQGNPDPKTANLIVSKMQEKGVIIAASKCRQLGNTLMIQVPLIITPEQLKFAFDTLDSVLKEIYSRDTITLEDNFEAGVLEGSVTGAFSFLSGISRRDGKPVFKYRYDPENEVTVEYNGILYKFSFVPQRTGDYDRPIPLSEIPDPKTIMDIGPHKAPPGRPCPFCEPLPEETLFFLTLPSGREYTLTINIEEYGEEHMVLATKEEIAQVLDEGRINDLLAATKALGAGYEGSFTSLSGASVLHCHGQFYRKKTPVWKNIEEGRVEIENKQEVDGVTVGDLSGWPARTRIIQGEDLDAVSRIVWAEIDDLVSKRIPYNTKIVYADGVYKWLIAPRVHGFMTYAGYFLKKRGAREPKEVSGCGSIESPGGDAVMFFKNDPSKLTEAQKRLMAKRFSKTLRETSNWDWEPPVHTPSSIKKHASLWRDGQLNLERPVNIAHRIESLDQAETALSKGAKVLEVDVQMTKDNVLVAFWGNVEAEGSEEGKCVYELTFDELEGRLQRSLLKINDLFEMVKGNAAVDLDIKDWSDGIEGYRGAVLSNIVGLIKAHDMADDVFAESFNGEYVEELMQLAGEQSIKLVTGIAIPGDREVSGVLQGYIDRAIEVHASAVFIYPNQLTRQHIDALHSRGLMVVTERGGLDEALINEVDMLASEYKKDFLEMSQEEILKGVHPDIKDHSIRHSQIAVMIAEAMNLPDEQIEMVRRISWAHDIGGFAKVEHPQAHKGFLQLEFVTCEGEGHGAKPSFNPGLCIEHAEERVRLGLRGPLTDEERRDPYPLYQEEFEGLKGGPLTATEELVLRSWWYHALYSVELLKERNVLLTPETEVLIRCNEQPWLLDSDPAMVELAKNFKLEPGEVRRLLAIVRASDILENGNNKRRRDLRGVPVEDFDTTVNFVEYKFRIDGLLKNRGVIEAIKKVIVKDDGELQGVVSEARESDELLPEDNTFIENQRRLDKIPLAKDSSIKAVIFDWGRVISRFDWRIPARELARRYGIDEEQTYNLLKDEEENPEHPLYKHERGLITEEQMISEVKKLIGLEHVEISKEEFEEMFNSIWVDDVIGEVVSLMHTLKEKGYKVYLLTITNAINYRYFVEHSGLLELLELTEEDIFASHMKNITKPDARSYMEIVDYAGLTPQQCLFVDDRQDNVDGATGALLEAVLFNADEIGESIESIINELQIPSYKTPRVVTPLPFPKQVLGTDSPDWVEFSLIVGAILELCDGQDESIKLGTLREKVIEKYKIYKMSYKNSRFIQLINSMRRSELVRSNNNIDFILDDSEDVILNVSPRMLALWAGGDAVFYIQNELSEAVSSGTILGVLQDYARIRDMWLLYGLESMDPVLKALTLMEEAEVTTITDALYDYYGDSLRPPLIDTILLLYAADKITGQWLATQAPELMDRRHYLVAAEISLLAGGLGRVMQYHGNGHKDLGIDVTYIEPMYRRRKDGSTINYEEDLPVKVDFVKEDDGSNKVIRLSAIVQGGTVDFEVYCGINENGIPVYFIRDIIPDGATGSIVDQLYTYKDDEHPDSVGVFDFTEFFTKATLELIRYLEVEKKKKEGNKWRAPVIDANDGQALPLAAFCEIFYRNGRELDPAIVELFNEITICGTTHTYRNRVNTYDYAGGLEYLLQAGIPAEWLRVFLRKDTSGQLVWDFTSAGLRCADVTKGVSAVHAYEVGYIDPMINLVGMRNGDNLEYSGSFFDAIMRELYGQEKTYDSLNPEEIGRVKSKAKERLRWSYEEADGATADDAIRLNPDQLVISYSGRLVEEKAGAREAFTRENIFSLVEAGVQIVIYGNEQPSRSSKRLAEQFREIESAIAHAKTRNPERYKGLFIFKDTFTIEDQLQLLAASDIQVQYSTRGTGACEYTEADVTRCGGLQLSPPFWEGIIGKQGIPINWESLTGNTIVLKDSQTTSFHDIVLHSNELFQERPEDFLQLQANSIRINHILDAKLTSAEYLRFWNSAVREKRTDRTRPKVLGELQAVRLSDIDLTGADEEISVSRIESGFRVTGESPLKIAITVDLRAQDMLMSDLSKLIDPHKIRIRLRDKHGRVTYLKYKEKKGEHQALFTTDLENLSFDGYIELSSGLFWQKTQLIISNSPVTEKVARDIERELSGSFQVSVINPYIDPDSFKKEIVVTEGKPVTMHIKFPFSHEELKGDLRLILHSDVFGEWDDIADSQISSSEYDPQDGVWKVSFIPQKSCNLTFYVTLKSAPHIRVWFEAFAENIEIRIQEPELQKSLDTSL